MAAVALSPQHYGRRLLGAAVAPPHSVKFYDSATFLAEAVADYFEAGLRCDEACIAVVRPTHWAHIERQLIARGCDPSQVVVLDAEDTLAKFLVGATPDRARFRATIEPVLAAARP